MQSRLVLRIVVPSLVVSLLLLGLGSFSGWYVLRQQKQASSLLAESVLRVRTAVEIVSTCREMRFQLGQFALTGNSESRQALETLLKQLPELLDRGEKLAPSEEERRLLNEVRQGHQQLQTELDALTAGPEAESRLRLGEVVSRVATDLMVNPAERHLDASKKAIDRSSGRSLAMAGRIAMGFILLGVCGAVAGLLAGYGIARGVRQTLFLLHIPIRTATGKLEEVIGPIELGEPQDLHELDSMLKSLAERVVALVDQLRESQLELLRAEQLAALGQLAAGMAHELRNPLTSIKILVQAAAEAGEAASLEGRDLAVLNEELTRLEVSLQRFLDFARPPTLEKRLFDVRDVIERLLELVSARAAQQQVRLDRELPGTPVEIWADREQIRQLLLNTLLNALDAVGHGGKIHVSLRIDGAPAGSEDARLTNNRRWATIVVQDNGPGIPAELEDRIFEPFVSTKDTGLGLGLAICRRIAEAHGGEIRAANTSEGPGAVLSISLPLGAPEGHLPAQE